MKIDELSEILKTAAASVESMFDEAKVTILIRRPHQDVLNDSDILVTNDEWDNISSSLKYLKSRERFTQ